MLHPHRPLTALCLAVAAACAQAGETAHDFAIPPQPLARVLDALARQTGLQPVYTENAVRGVHSPGVQGRHAPREALAAALAGTGLTHRFTGERSVAILPASGEHTPILREVEVRAGALREPAYRAPAATVAGKTPRSLQEIPQSVSVLTRQQMDDQDMVTITEAMKQATGVTVIANDTVNNQYLVRGFGLGVMYDGVPSYNGMTPSHQLGLAAYERIEVLRGPAGLMRGSGEPGGVVNFVRKRPRDVFGLNWEASAGSWDNYRLEGDITGPLNADKTLRGRLLFSNEDRGYFYDHTHGRKWLGLGSLELDLSPATTLSLSFAAQDQDVKAPWSGLPAYKNLTDPNNGIYPLLDVPQSTFHVPDWGKMRYRTEESAVGVEHRFDSQWVAKALINHRVQRQYYKYAYSSSGIDPTDNTLQYSSQRGDFDYSRDGIDLHAAGPFDLLGRRHELLLGFNAERYGSKGQSARGTAINNVVFGDTGPLIEPELAYTSGSESRTTQSGLYTQARLSIADPLTLVLGARTTTFNAKTRAIAPSAATAWKQGARADNEITPYGALLYDLAPGVKLYGSYTDIFVPQTQLKADGGTLDPRTGKQYEIGSKVEFLEGRLAASLALFNIRDRNRAYADPAYPSSSFYLNAGEIESKGWEVETTGSPLRGLDIVAGYTNLATKYLSDPSNQGKTFSIQSPRHLLKLWGNYRFAADSAWSGLSAGIGLLAQSRTQSTRGWRDQLLEGGHTVVNARLAYQIDKAHSLSLAIDNLFDRKYYETVGTPNIYNFYGEPRSFKLTLRATY